MSECVAACRGETQEPVCGWDEKETIKKKKKNICVHISLNKSNIFTKSDSPHRIFCMDRGPQAFFVMQHVSSDPPPRS